MRTAQAITNLTNCFTKLPGVGPKTAQRLAYYLLHVPQSELEGFATALTTLKSLTHQCAVCCTMSESDPCELCADATRDKTKICVVSQPLDVLAFERSGIYKGLYHVLHGVIDPLHNIGPDEITIPQLMKRLASNTMVNEIILAVNPTMEGEATSIYIKRLVKEILSDRAIKLTRLAHGLPIGADIEYADDVTLSQALDGRRDY